jgi:hypothetical protein
MAPQLIARNASAQDLVALLNTQKAEKLDLVVPAANVWSKDGKIVVKNAEPQITDEGVSTVNGTYRPTEVFDEGLASKLEIPSKYVQRLRADRPDLLDANVNGLLHGRALFGKDGTRTEIYPADTRAFLLRLFRGDGGEGVARAMLSDRYSLGMDNLDMLTAVMKGVQDAGVNVITRVSDLSERRMRVRFEAPDVYTQAPGLLDGYRSPFDGGGAVRRAGSFNELRQQYGQHHIFSEKDAPIAFIGFDFTNSETGSGAYTLTPVIEMVRCTNGWVMRREGLRKVHLGSKLEAGNVTPSLDTLRKAGTLVAAETRDAIKQWLTQGYLEQLIASLTEKAATPIASPANTVPAVTKSLGFTSEEQDGILDLFIKSGQPTAGGVAQAISAYAQIVEDPDRAYDIELKAVDGLDEAARIGARA